MGVDGRKWLYHKKNPDDAGRKDFPCKMWQMKENRRMQKQPKRRGDCAECCDFFINLIKCTKTSLGNILTIRELNINMER